MKYPLVSVIVPTYNSAEFIGACLESIVGQSYKHVELIVVDNNSTDDTKSIAKKYTDKVYNKGPERSAQRNYGVKKSKGEYVVIVDSDMELTKDVVKACVAKAQDSKNTKGIIIPEESFGEGFWAQCKKLERSFYVGVDWMEAARFYDKKIYQEFGGFDEDMVSGEDWDLSQRVGNSGRIERIDNYILHNEGGLKLGKTLRKKFYYGTKIDKYRAKHIDSKYFKKQSSLTSRYGLYLSRPMRLFRSHVYGLGMLIMKLLEIAATFLGFSYATIKRLAKTRRNSE